MPTWLVALITGIGVAVTGIIGLFIKSKVDNKKVTDAHETLGESGAIKGEIDGVIKDLDGHIGDIKDTHESNNEVISKAEIKKKENDGVISNAENVVIETTKKVETKREKLDRKKKELAAKRKAIDAKKNSL